MGTRNGDIPDEFRGFDPALAHEKLMEKEKKARGS